MDRLIFIFQNDAIFSGPLAVMVLIFATSFGKGFCGDVIRRKKPHLLRKVFLVHFFDHR